MGKVFGNMGELYELIFVKGECVNIGLGYEIVF